MNSRQHITLDVHPSALQAVTDQADYYIRHGSSALATRWELAVDDIIQSLLQFPLRGSPRRFSTLDVQDIRIIAVPGFQKHLVLYRFLEDRNSLIIVYVTHGARDYVPDLAALLSK